MLGPSKGDGWTGMPGSKGDQYKDKNRESGWTLLPGKGAWRFGGGGAGSSARLALRNFAGAFDGVSTGRSGSGTFAGGRNLSTVADWYS